MIKKSGLIVVQTKNDLVILSKFLVEANKCFIGQTFNNYIESCK